MYKQFCTLKLLGLMKLVSFLFLFCIKISSLKILLKFIWIPFFNFHITHSNRKRNHSTLVFSLYSTSSISPNRFTAFHPPNQLHLPLSTFSQSSFVFFFFVKFILNFSLKFVEMCINFDFITRDLQVATCGRWR